SARTASAYSRSSASYSPRSTSDSRLRVRSSRARISAFTTPDGRDGPEAGGEGDMPISLVARSDRRLRVPGGRRPAKRRGPPGTPASPLGEAGRPAETRRRLLLPGRRPDDERAL